MVRIQASLRFGIVNIFTSSQTQATWQVKAPWCKPLFSEREGHRVPRFKFLGFRIFRRTAEWEYSS